MFFNLDARFGRKVEIVLSTLDYIEHTYLNFAVDAHKSTLMAKLSRFPPSASATFFGLRLILHDEPVEDVVIATSCGGANCLGSAKEFSLPREKLSNAYWHYIRDYPDRASKQTNDHVHEAWISELIA